VKNSFLERVDEQPARCLRKSQSDCHLQRSCRSALEEALFAAPVEQMADVCSSAASTRSSSCGGSSPVSASAYTCPPEVYPHSHSPLGAATGKAPPGSWADWSSESSTSAGSDAESVTSGDTSLANTWFMPMATPFGWSMVPQMSCGYAAEQPQPQPRGGRQQQRHAAAPPDSRPSPKQQRGSSGSKQAGPVDALSAEGVTTLNIRVPPKTTTTMLVSMIQECMPEDSFDAVHVPPKNLASKELQQFGFVNFRTPELAQLFLQCAQGRFGKIWVATHQGKTAVSKAKGYKSIKDKSMLPYIAP